MRPVLVRLTHLVMALYLAMSGIELLDHTEFGGQHDAVAETAETLRETRAGDDPLGLMRQAREIIGAIRQVIDGFGESADALN